MVQVAEKAPNRPRHLDRHHFPACRSTVEDVKIICKEKITATYSCCFCVRVIIDMLCLQLLSRTDERRLFRVKFMRTAHTHAHPLLCTFAAERVSRRRDLCAERVGCQRIALKLVRLTPFWARRRSVHPAATLLSHSCSTCVWYHRTAENHGRVLILCPRRIIYEKIK